MTETPQTSDSRLAGVLRGLVPDDAPGRELVTQLLGLVADAIVITDGDNRIVAVNDAFETVTGYAQADVIGRNPSMLASGRHSPEFYAHLWEALERDGRWQGEIWNRRKSGEVYAQWLGIRRLAGAAGPGKRHIGVFSDLVAGRRADPGHAVLADRDRLTGTPGIALLRDRIEQSMHRADRELGTFAIVLADIDRFRDFNAKRGHEAGDRLLIEFAHRLRSTLRDEDTVSRTGSDEFALLLPRAGHESAEVLADRIAEAMERPFELADEAITATCSMAIVAYPSDGRDAVELVGNARGALRLAKADGGGSCRLYDPQAARRLARRSRIRRALRTTAPERHFHLAFLPQVNLATGRVEALEALARWSDASLGQPSPQEFIPIADESGLAPRLGEWVIARALHEAGAWGNEGGANLRLSVNVSALHLAEPDFSDRVLELLAAAGWPVERFEIEVGERARIGENAAAVASMLRLRAAGVRFALDDFGTGDASITALRSLAFATLKIDRRLVSRIGEDGRDEALVASIARLARSLGIHCVGEGIESDAQRDFLREAGVPSGQGFRIAAPLEAGAVAGWLRQAGG